MRNLAIVWPAIAAAFLASFVEAVEVFTIVLAASTFRGWRLIFDCPPTASRLSSRSQELGNGGT